jgi:hypothetical protein
MHRRIASAHAVALAAVVCCPPQSIAAAAPGDADANALRRRVETLEKQVKDLTRVVKSQAKELKALRQAKTAPPQTPARRELKAAKKDMTEEAAARSGQRHAVWSKLGVQLYGRLKADAAVDSTRASVGNFIRWVQSEQGRGKDSQFAMTANETRLGMNITGPTFDAARTRGRVEIDFYGGGAENKPNPMLRHAYVAVDWPQHRLSVLAGQSSDLLSPLVPTTLNYPVLWWAGNIGYRRPQVRVTKDIALGEGCDLRLAGAIARTIGHDNAFSGGDTGQDAGCPSLQGRAAVSFPLIGRRKATLGVSGHLAREEHDFDATNDNEDVCSWSGNVDLTLPVADWLALKAEGFIGENIDAYLGGIGQGVVVQGQAVKELRSAGGWFAASLGPWDNWNVNVGASGEFICNDGALPATGRTTNSAVFGNVIYQINPNTQVGVEVSRWLTEYHGQKDGDAIRVQSSFIYKF